MPFKAAQPQAVVERERTILAAVARFVGTLTVWSAMSGQAERIGVQVQDPVPTPARV